MAGLVALVVVLALVIGVTLGRSSSDHEGSNIGSEVFGLIEGRYSSCSDVEAAQVIKHYLRVYFRIAASHLCMRDGKGMFNMMQPNNCALLVVRRRASWAMGRCAGMPHHGQTQATTASTACSLFLSSPILLRG